MLSKLMLSYWWVLLLRGVLAILFGIAAYAWPGMTLVTLLTLFGAFAFVDGIFNVFHAFSGRKEDERWWVLLLEGLLGIAIGVITFQAPEITATVLILYIGFWAMATGVLRIVLAVRLRKEIEGEWWMALAGLAGIVFGVFMVARPGAGALAGNLAGCDLGDRGWCLSCPPLIQGERAWREARRGQAKALGQSLGSMGSHQGQTAP